MRIKTVSALRWALVLFIATLTCSTPSDNGNPPPPPPPPPAPTVDIKVESSDGPVSVIEGAVLMRSWNSTNTTQGCFAFGSWSGEKVASGSEQTEPLAIGMYMFGMRCANATQSVRDSVAVVVEETPPPPLNTRVLFAEGSDFYLAPLHGGNAELLSTGGGARVFPAPSPGRDRITYVGVGSCHNAEPFVSPLDFTSRTALPCVHEGSAQSPVFSPDGMQIAFQAAGNVAGFANVQLSAFVASVTGTSAHQISAFHTCQSADGPPPCFANLGSIYVAYSPQGEIVTSLQEIIDPSQALSHNNVVVSWSVTTGVLRRVKTFSSARLIMPYAVSADGNWIAAASIDWQTLNDEQVLLIRADGSEVRELTGRDGSQWPFFCGVNHETVSFVRRSQPNTLVHVDRQGNAVGETSFNHAIENPRCF